jgi:hypothetical protein
VQYKKEGVVVLPPHEGLEPVAKIVESLPVPVTFVRLESYVAVSLKVLESCLQPPEFDTTLGLSRGARVLATLNPDSCWAPPRLMPVHQIAGAAGVKLSLAHQDLVHQQWQIMYKPFPRYY